MIPTFFDNPSGVYDFFLSCETMTVEDYKMWNGYSDVVDGEKATLYVCFDHGYAGPVKIKVFLNYGKTNILNAELYYNRISGRYDHDLEKSYVRHSYANTTLPHMTKDQAEQIDHILMYLKLSRPY